MAITDDAIGKIKTSPSTGSPSSGSGGSSSSEPDVFWRTVGGAAGRPTTKRGPLLPRANTAPDSIRVGPAGGIIPGGKVTRGFTPSQIIDERKSLTEAIGEFYKWTDAERFKWGDHLVKLGLIDADKARDYTTLRNMWTDVVNETANFTTAGHRYDPWKVAEIMAGDAATAGPKGPTTTTSRSKNVDLTSAAGAKGIINDALSKQLGRAATATELEEFRRVLNSAETANPNITDTTTTVDAEGNSSTSSTTSSGGLDRAQVLQDQAMLKPEYGAYQAATTYMSALMSAIQSPVST